MCRLPRMYRISAPGCRQVFDALADRLAIQHDMKLRGEDQHADPGQHAVYHRRRYGAEPLARA